jgi:hypothetical protein
MAPFLPHRNHKGSSFIRETSGDYWALFRRNCAHTHTLVAPPESRLATCHLLAGTSAVTNARTHVVAYGRKCQLYANKHCLTMSLKNEVQIFREHSNKSKVHPQTSKNRLRSKNACNHSAQKLLSNLFCKRYLSYRGLFGQLHVWNPLPTQGHTRLLHFPRQ